MGMPYGGHRMAGNIEWRPRYRGFAIAAADFLL
jgi:hypothetical protein